MQACINSGHVNHMRVDWCRTSFLVAAFAISLILSVHRNLLYVFYTRIFGHRRFNGNSIEWRLSNKTKINIACHCKRLNVKIHWNKCTLSICNTRFIFIWLLLMPFARLLHLFRNISALLYHPHSMEDNITKFLFRSPMHRIYKVHK